MVTNGIPPIVVGTFQNDSYENLLAVVGECVRKGIYGFDTAPSYGTEDFLGRAIREQYKVCSRKDFFVSTKIDAWQMQDGNIDLFVKNALKKTGLEYFDMLLIHWPIEEYITSTWEAMCRLKDMGVVKNIGICNVRVRHLEKLKKEGIEPSFIQIERHPLRVCELEMQYCKANDIIVFAYSPLCRMHPHLSKNDALNALSRKYGKSLSQIILRWHIETGSRPIFMTKKIERIHENVDIFDFSLQKEDVETISALNENYKIFLESWGCPGF